MSFRNSTILTGGVLGLLLTLGAMNNASAGHDMYGDAPKHGYGADKGYQDGYALPGHYGYSGDNPVPVEGFVQHPVMGFPVPMTHGYG